MSALEMHLNQHLLMLRLMERSVHSPEGDWRLRFDDQEIRLQVVVSDFAVSLWAILPPFATPSVTVDVLCDEDHLWTRTIEVPEGCATELEWTFAMNPYVASAA